MGSRPVLAVFALLAAPGLLFAQGFPQGPEFRVNTFSTLGQRVPAVAADLSSGNFLVVWVSYHVDRGRGSLLSAQRDLPRRLRRVLDELE